MPTADLKAASLGALRALGVRGFADTDAVATITSEPPEVVASYLAIHAEAGLVTYREGRVTGWSLTTEGRTVLKTSLASQLAEAGNEADLEAGYGSFLALNEPIKQLCTDWQLEGQPSRCIDELATVHERLEPVLAQLSTASPWFAAYLPRFAAALTRLQAGDLDAFTKPLSGSYHDVWMELHQDLLLALGRTRGDADGH